MMDQKLSHGRTIWGTGIVLLLLCLVMIAPRVGFAAPVSPTQADLPKSCDAAFMTKMTNRATAEAARDTVLAQATIRRADSVLEYSCFTQFASIAADVAAKLFTETTHWKDGAGSKVDISSYDPHHSPGPVIVDITAFQPEGTVADALQNVVVDALSKFVGSNFAHVYLGTAKPTTGVTTSAAAGSSYNCSDMQVVWHVSKCDNFLSEDLFTKLGQSDDIRSFPEQCGGTGFAGIDVKAPSDPTVTHLQKVHRDAPNVQSCDAQVPIATGRFVEKLRSSSKPAQGAGTRDVLREAEKICLLPGCYYDYESKKCAE